MITFMLQREGRCFISTGPMDETKDINIIIYIKIFISFISKSRQQYIKQLPFHFLYLWALGKLDYFPLLLRFTQL